MPHSIFFMSRGHAIHGSDAVKKLGTPASHGCIRLSRENAATLFSLVKEQGLENTRIAILGKEAVAVAGKNRIRTAERKQRNVRSAARRGGQEWVWGYGTGGWVVQPRYQQPQPFWSPFPYAARSYGW